MYLHLDCYDGLSTFSIIKVLDGNGRLRTLAVSNSGWRTLHFPTENLALIADIVESNIALSSLSFKSYCIGDKDAAILARAFRQNETLKQLDLSFDCVAGALLFCKALPTDHSIESFHFHRIGLPIRSGIRVGTTVEIIRSLAQTRLKVLKYSNRQ